MRIQVKLKDSKVTAFCKYTSWKLNILKHTQTKDSVTWPITSQSKKRTKLLKISFHVMDCIHMWSSTHAQEHPSTYSETSQFTQIHEMQITIQPSLTFCDITTITITYQIHVACPLNKYMETVNSPWGYTITHNARNHILFYYIIYYCIYS